jgi:hypothetical protein
MELRDILVNTSTGPVTPDTPFTEAVPVLVQLRGAVGKDIEYGCFNLNGTLIEDYDLLSKRRSRNIMYYIIRDLFGISWGGRQYGWGAPIGKDPVPDSPDGHWAVMLTGNCPNKDLIERALSPLIEHRAGAIITIPNNMGVMEFQSWLREQFNDHKLPPYLLICDSFKNIPLEYQFIFNAFAVTGRLWLDELDAYETYVRKVLAVERGEFKTGSHHIVATPMDDEVTYADYGNIIAPMLPVLEAASFPLNSLIGKPDFEKQKLLSAVNDASFLALYCHGMALPQEEWQRQPNLQGSFVLEKDSKQDGGLLTAGELSATPFVPGGIVFSPACLSAGTQANSDFAAWIDPVDLPNYLGVDTRLSANSLALLSSPSGPIAMLAPFDISLVAPMYNPMTRAYDFQREVHLRFIENLSRRQTIGKATSPFRWGAGAFYAQAISVFGQIAGTVSYSEPRGLRKPMTIGEFIIMMNSRHITATEMRNYVILGDPAVRLAN